jgi:hypothetical protein
MFFVGLFFYEKVELKFFFWATYDLVFIILIYKVRFVQDHDGCMREQFKALSSKNLFLIPPGSLKGNPLLKRIQCLYKG